MRPRKTELALLNSTVGTDQTVDSCTYIHTPYLITYQVTNLGTSINARKSDVSTPAYMWGIPLACRAVVDLYLGREQVYRPLPWELICLGAVDRLKESDIVAKIRYQSSAVVALIST
jgi:hypothetical protein